MRNKLSLIALRTSLLYVVIAALWILFSDRLLAVLIPDAPTLSLLSTYKGLAFVAITALLLYTTLRRQLGAWEQEAARRRQAEEDRMQMERQILQSQKLESLGVLAGGIAHDFNNILMAVLGHADLALSELPPTSPARDSLAQIEQAARRAAELCRQMLAYSGRGKFLIETLDLGELIEELVHLLKTSISKKALLHLKLAPNLPPLRGDASQIRQIIMNLVINASEAIGEKSGTVVIATGAGECTREELATPLLEGNPPDGHYVWLEVADTGCGMDSDTQSRLFEPFFTTKFMGRGLGMAAVLGIVRGHQGALKVHSQPGQGTTFRVYFPAVAGPEAPEGGKPEEVGAEWRGAGLVLLADDEPFIRALGRKMLEKLGFRVLTAEDGREAVKLYQAQASQIDLVILDLTMPHMNGEETFHELRRLNPAVRVIISSGFTGSEIAARFAGWGISGFVQKPYTLAVLRDCISATLGAPLRAEQAEPGARERQGVEGNAS